MAIEVTMMEPQANDVSPDEITISRDRSTLTLSTEGRRELLPAEQLRLACRCAWCTRDRLTEGFPERFPGVSIARVAPIGSHALHISFSDGHARGIFPFRYLQQIAAREDAA